MLYADDTIILAESDKELQNALIGLDDYCKRWKLTVNENKTKVVIFSRGKVRKFPVFTVGTSKLEIVYNYDYLGVTINYNGKFNEATKNRYDKGCRSMYAMLNKIRDLNLPIDIQLKLFDSLVTPVITYGCEVWGCNHIDIIEKIHLRFCKIILSVKNSTNNVMVYGELGRYPIKCHIQCRILSYWYKLIQPKNKLSNIMYKLEFQMMHKQLYDSTWLIYVRDCLNKL